MLTALRPALALCLSAAPCLADGPIGVASMAAGGMPDRPLALSIWYPADAGGILEDVGQNAVFVGASGRRDAPVAAGRFPVVILSHGGLRSAADSGAWLGAQLAAAGFMVVEVTGPRPGGADAAMDEIWRRPMDVSRALDGVLRDPVWSAHVDQDRISVVGFALGGTAALAVAGGALDAAAVARACDDGADGPDCAWFAAQGVSLGSVAPEELERPRRDPRITAAVAIAPEYITAFSPGSLATSQARRLVVELGGRDDVATGAGEPAGPTRTRLPDATVFDMFSVCTPKAPAILAEEGAGAEICEGEPADRERLHGAIAGRIAGFLARQAPAKVAIPLTGSK